MVGVRAFDEAAAMMRRSGRASVRDDRELIRVAVLAASSHNTQPWLFRVAPDAITILPDRSRRCPVVDADDAHLYKSLGCAAENLVHAVSLQGLAADVRYDPDQDAVIVALEERADVVPSEFSGALGTRQCTKTAYDGTALDDEDLTALARAGSVGSVRCLIITDRERTATVAALVERGNVVQLTDRAFRRELLEWIRFNPRTALQRRDGLAGRVNGQPPVPSLLGRLLAPILIRASSQARKDRDHLQSSAGLAVFCTSSDTAADWVAAGRAYERFSLGAELLHIRSAFVNQPIEVPELRDELRACLEVTAHPQLMVRFGKGPRCPYSLRRPIHDVLVA
jgi:nitroreductase